MLKTFKDQNCRGQISYMETDYFQQSGATVHTALAAMVVLRNMFPEQMEKHMFPGQQNSRLVT